MGSKKKISKAECRPLNDSHRKYITYILKSSSRSRKSMPFHGVKRPDYVGISKSVNRKFHTRVKKNAVISFASYVYHNILK